MAALQIVIDTNVLVSALRSKRGASFRLLSLVDSNAFQINLSVPLVLEYEDVLVRAIAALSIGHADIAAVLDYLCKIGNRHQIRFLWRPFLKDPRDDMLLELAVTANCDFIVTYNRRDFAGIEAFGLQAIEPIDLLRKIGDLP